MAWISRTVFASESDDEDEDEHLKEEPSEDIIEPKRKQKKVLQASSAYELLKLFYIWFHLYSLRMDMTINFHVEYKARS